MATIITSPNQKVLRVNKEECNQNMKYAKINLAAMEAAAKDLDGNVFKLWCYFARNKNDFTCAVSNVAVTEQFGIKKDTYDRAMRILKEKGYITKIRGNYYEFHEVAQQVEENNDLF
ncbi:MAG: hypothetical protein IKL08_01725 [Clostridia bacterium]|nr:hypothetical protein [Clostridia bacterium]